MNNIIMNDRLYSDKAFRAFKMIGDCSCESLATEVDSNIHAWPCSIRPNRYVMLNIKSRQWH